MKNKTFTYWIHAKFYYDQVSKNYTAFCIYNNESEIYEVIDLERYNDYIDFDLEMWPVTSIMTK